MKQRFLPALVLIGVPWFALYIGFSIARIDCVPAFSERCLSADWQSLGDLVLLHSIERWQTLFAGGLAIIAAFIGGAYINKQLQHAERIEQERLRRRHEALRAIMPLALMSLLDYCNGVVVVLRDIYGDRQNGVCELPAEAVTIPNLPSEVIDSVRDLIEVSGLEFRAPLARMLSKLQVQNARVRSLQRSVAPDGRRRELSLNIEQYIIDTATVYAYGTMFLEYARQDREDVLASIPWPNVSSALNNLGFWSTEYEDIHATIVRREGQGLSP